MAWKYSAWLIPLEMGEEIRENVLRKCGEIYIASLLSQLLVPSILDAYPHVMTSTELKSLANVRILKKIQIHC